MDEGIYIIKIHGTETYYYHNEGKFFLPERKKNRWAYYETFIAPERVKKMKLVNVPETLNILNGG